MEQGTNLSHDSKPGQTSPARHYLPTPTYDNGAIRTHVLLVIAMAVVIVCVTSFSLLLVQHRLHTQVTADLSQDLSHSVVTFNDLQAVRLGALERENALLADLPPMKALMTSSDDLTIRDGAVEFWDLSGNDLFALADPSGRIIAAYTKEVATAGFKEHLQQLMQSMGKRYVIDGGSLYACSVRPLYFGSPGQGSVLGYVISGVSIERTVRQISQPTGVEATFVSNSKIVASTLAPQLQATISPTPAILMATPRNPATIWVGGTRFLAATEDLSGRSTSPLQLVVLKSLEPAEQSIERINRLLLFTGLLALLIGTGLMIALSRLVTRPLEELSKGVRAFGEGDVQHELPTQGPREVRELSTLFARMRSEIQSANRALLESERLATIGRMASSVSHDLRHYLAAVFANAEFLASDRLSTKERAEIFADIRTAVEGTTEMIESLLTFSRTGDSTRRTSELLSTLLDRAVNLVRSHPDAEGVNLMIDRASPSETAVFVDAKQIERAIYNLLLNACQAVRASSGPAEVHAALEAIGFDMVLRIRDTGSGVPQTIRDSLFAPFISEGKQKGTGLGLTLASAIAAEHGGEVTLIRSRPGETIFEMRVPRELQPQLSPPAPKQSDSKEVIAG
jgi:signal transduction histidine kinase